MGGDKPTLYSREFTLPLLLNGCVQFPISTEGGKFYSGVRKECNSSHLKILKKLLSSDICLLIRAGHIHHVSYTVALTVQCPYTCSVQTVVQYLLLSL